MANIPPLDVQDAFLAPVAEIIRRVEIYEADGETPWRQDLWDSWLVEGSVSADQASDERRTFECVLDNTDGDLDPEAGKLWYDKIFKAIYGIELNQKPKELRVIIVEDYESPGEALALKSLLSKAGVTYVHYNPLVSNYKDVEDFDVLVSITSTYTRKLGLLTEAFNRGKSVMTAGLNATAAQLPYIIGGANGNLSTDSGERTFVPASLQDEIVLGWENWNFKGPQSYRKIIAPAAGAQVVAHTSDVTNGLSPGVIRRGELGGSRWLHIMQNKFSESEIPSGLDDAITFMARAMRWLDTYYPRTKWETQLGEFVSDSISDANEFGDLIKVSGRDYVARCMSSKLPAATMHTKDQSIESIVRTHANLSGIKKMNLPVTGIVLDKDTTWEADTDRWTIMKEVATNNNLELYFNAFGYLQMTPYKDPLLSPPALTLTTGLNGNLVSRGASTSANRLFNHVIAVGESSDSSTPPVWAEVKNENPNSPTNIDAIGDRVTRIVSPLITEVQQAIELAKSLLAVSALEEFELNFSSVFFPWVEPGEILEMYDPDSQYWGPDRFLISSISFPLDLGPMSGTAKRVTRVV